mgnify:CR=1 FL=1
MNKNKTLEYYNKNADNFAKTTIKYAYESSTVFTPYITSNILNRVRVCKAKPKNPCFKLCFLIPIEKLSLQG